MRSRMLVLWLIVLALGGSVLAACAPAAHLARRPQKAPSSSLKPSHKPPGSAVTDPAAAACLGMLRRLRIGTRYITPTDAGPPYVWPKIVLSATLTGGPTVRPSRSLTLRYASSVQTATWNLLSGSVGLPLLPHLGQALREVSISPSASTRIGGYTCLERGPRVVGLYAQTKGYSFQPMFDLSARGRTVQELTRKDYLSWLEEIRAYVPRPVQNSPSLSAQEVLLDYFAAINAPLSQARRKALEATLVAPSANGAEAASALRLFTAFVPLSISPSECPGSNADQELSQSFGVAIWPHFRHFNQKLMAGNGWVYFIFSLSRPTTSSAWRVAGAGTGC